MSSSTQAAVPHRLPRGMTPRRPAGDRWHAPVDGTPQLRRRRQFEPNGAGHRRPAVVGLRARVFADSRSTPAQRAVADRVGAHRTGPARAAPSSRAAGLREHGEAGAGCTAPRRRAAAHGPRTSTRPTSPTSRGDPRQAAVSTDGRSRVDARSTAAGSSRCSRVDEGVGADRRRARADGELDDTLVVYTSDNGFFAGEHRVATGKNRVYEEAIRVPLVIRGPGVPAGGRSRPVRSTPTSRRRSSTRPAPSRAWRRTAIAAAFARHRSAATAASC